MRKAIRAHLGQALRGSGDLYGTDHAAYLTRSGPGGDRLRLTLEHRAAPALEPLELRLVSPGDGRATHLEVVSSSSLSSRPEIPPAHTPGLALAERVVQAIIRALASLYPASSCVTSCASITTASVTSSTTSSDRGASTAPMLASPCSPEPEALLPPMPVSRIGIYTPWDQPIRYAIRPRRDRTSVEALRASTPRTTRAIEYETTRVGGRETQQHLDKQPEDLASIAREAVDLYEFVSGGRGVHVLTQLSSGGVVTVDRRRTMQVCANLLDNAIKYTDAGGSVEVSVTSDEANGILTMADTGIGIPPEDRERVWDRLFRGDRRRTERGLGLGLSLVKAVVEAHAGEVRLRADTQIGSTFEVFLPLSRSKDQGQV